MLFLSQMYVYLHLCTYPVYSSITPPQTLLLQTFWMMHIARQPIGTEIIYIKLYVKVARKATLHLKVKMSMYPKYTSSWGNKHKMSVYFCAEFLSIYLSVRLSVCLSVWLPIFVCLFINFSKWATIVQKRGAHIFATQCKWHNNKRRLFKTGS